MYKTAAELVSNDNYYQKNYQFKDRSERVTITETGVSNVPDETIAIYEHLSQGLKILLKKLCFHIFIGIGPSEGDHFS